MNITINFERLNTFKMKLTEIEWRINEILDLIDSNPIVLPIGNLTVELDNLLSTKEANQVIYTHLLNVWKQEHDIIGTEIPHRKEIREIPSGNRLEKLHDLYLDYIKCANELHYGQGNAVINLYNKLTKNLFLCDGLKTDLVYTDENPFDETFQPEDEYSDVLDYIDRHQITFTLDDLGDEDIIDEITDIIAEFNFEKVHSVMEFLNWEWFINGRLQLPSIDYMIEFSGNLMADCYVRACTNESFENTL